MTELSTEQAHRLWNDNQLLKTVKLQDLLAVASGARKAALIILPAELPDAAELGMQIDKRYYAALGEGDDDGDQLSRALRRSLSKLKAKFQSETAFKKSLMSRVFVEVVQSSDSYKALRRWVRELKLRGEVEEARPTVHELYVAGNADTVLDIKDIGRLRRECRKAALRTGRAHRNVFPEDGFPEFGQHVGRLLGYPDCCIERYTFDRSSVVLTAEERASQQITDNPGKVDALTYFTRDFIPCLPNCGKAAEQGKAIYEGLNSLSEDLGQAYLTQVEANRERVVKFPEMIKAHVRELKERSSRK